MGDVIASRHIYVYGTGGNPSDEELAERRAQALKAAEWSVDRGPFWGRVMVFPRIISDQEVRPSDLESANLVLFGTKETNSLIARFSDQLPLHLDGDLETYGLVYAYVVGGRYVLVSSGLPWWQTGGGGPGSPFTGGAVAFGLMGLEDYLLFESSVDNAVASGRFDADWQLSAEDAETLRAIEAVTVTKSETPGSND